MGRGPERPGAGGRLGRRIFKIRETGDGVADLHGVHFGIVEHGEDLCGRLAGEKLADLAMDIVERGAVCFREGVAVAGENTVGLCQLAARTAGKSEVGGAAGGAEVGGVGRDFEYDAGQVLQVIVQDFDEQGVQVGEVEAQGAAVDPYADAQVGQVDGVSAAVGEDRFGEREDAGAHGDLPRRKDGRVGVVRVGNGADAPG